MTISSMLWYLLELGAAAGSRNTLELKGSNLYPLYIL